MIPIEYSAMIFTYPERFKQIMARHPRVRGQFLVWLKFYQEIDPIFSEEYLCGRSYRPSSMARVYLACRAALLHAAR